MPLANGTVLIPRGMLQWQHAFGDVTPVTALAFQGTGAAFSVAGIPIARDTALVEAGFDWRFAPQAKLGAFYQGELAAHAQTHAVKGASPGISDRRPASSIAAQVNSNACSLRHACDEPLRRHARPCAGHPRLNDLALPKTWMAGTSPAMTLC